jgi:O-acetyl-ADP-ribose deacetylase (regulator of RNase III)
VIEEVARALVFRARDAGWRGPPFNPVAIADLIKVPVEANVDVAEARTVPVGNGLKIEFNPTQPRERVRFSIAHEIAHVLFPDVAEAIRHRKGPNYHDNWQIETLCNIAAAEFVMPVGSLPEREVLPSLEELMLERRKFDVSAEAFLIRVAKVAREPIMMFCASACSDGLGAHQYRIDYAVGSPSSPELLLSGRTIPPDSCVQSCTAIGFTDKKIENWFGHNKLKIECVGIPGFPGTPLPRVAGLVRFTNPVERKDTIKYVQGDVFEPRGHDLKIICQLTNDLARTWGGGVARSAAKKFPAAQKAYSAWIISKARPNRLGQVFLAPVEGNRVVASLVAQEGFGASDAPRIRYTALQHCLETVGKYASEKSASVHMPRIGSGESGGDWETVEEILRVTLLRSGVSVTVYDLPPRRLSGNARQLGDLFG